MRRLAPFLLLAAAPFAGTAEQDSVIRVTTRLVEVHVIAQDRHGNPVAGLTRDDFVIKDRGVPQKLAIFAVEGEAVARDQRPAPLAPKLPPGVYSNLATPEAPASRTATVILIDKLNTRVSEQLQIKRKVLDFLGSGELRGQIAVLALLESGRLRTLTNFTVDTNSLKSAVAAERPWASELRRMSEIDLLDPGDVIADPGELEVPGGVPNIENRKAANYATVVRAARTLRALESIARGLAQVPGRKNVVWFSDAFPLGMGYGRESAARKGQVGVDRINLEPQVARSMRVLTDANVAIYPVDARGLTGVPMADSSYSGGPPQEYGTSTGPSVLDARTTMQTVSRMTGGKAYFGRNDLDGALREALDDSRLVYIIGYNPRDESWDGNFHPIEVQVKREGVKLRYRSGYYALSNQSSPQQASLLAVLNDPFAASAIGLIGSGARQGDQFRVSLTADTRSLTLAEAGGNWNGTLDALFVQEDAQGKVLDAALVEVPLKWPAETYQWNLGNGARFNRNLKMQPAAARAHRAARPAFRQDRIADHPAHVTLSCLSAAG